MIEIDLNKVIVYDIETLKNCIIICCRDYKTGSKKEFVFFNHKRYDDQPLAFFKFLKNCVKTGYTFVGFNSVAFDAQVLHLFYEWSCQKQDPLYNFELAYIINTLYEKAQEIIHLSDEERFKVLIPESKLFIQQIDLFKQKHYDRPAKATSLKWIQFSMRYPNIEEMPIPHDADILEGDIDAILEYCWNDVDSTFEFYKKIKYETEVRIQLSDEYGCNLINSAEPRMVREIFGKFLCKQMNITYTQLKEKRTIRKQIAFADIIFPYTKFQTQQFKEVLQVFKDKVLVCDPHSKDTFKHSFTFQGMSVDLGLGGIHACTKSGVYTPTEDEIIEDADGTSFYPFLAIANGLRPAHLGAAFNVVYPMMFEERKKYDKKDPKNYIFKIILNSCYGLSKEINSYLYDPQFTYSITLNGQLSLLMLVEALSISVPDIKFLQMNTDGVTYVYNKTHTDMVRKICKWWEKTTKINLEYAYYSKMIIQDVNNYIGVYTDGKNKKKGMFEIDMDFHKNPSHLIVTKALEQHFVYGKDYINYIKDPENSIYDYCGGVKRKNNFKLNLYKDLGSAEIAEEQQKVTRYYVSIPTYDSGRLIKDFDDGRKVSVLANKLVTPCNKIYDERSGNYKLDYDWYISETKKIIEGITPSTTQTTLF